ncbi:TPA: hypothetical protein N0F65_012752 [Lagenidium giganteum]|uniref:Amino acid permease/ SLC12A domain-containing protein n=1 Tax=Lagenidium giganteum TaxID=4803 RepID=A0AAV2YBN0_9STRA|nr:TPA: hypothetical protein N0F65_012752 [Lagenidium giganteum]
MQPPIVGNYRPGGVDIFFLGITMVIGGQYIIWNEGLKDGVYGYAIACLLMGAAYVVFCCCIAEITGALPFAGGSYGLTRCTLGLYMGFLIGCCEALEYIVYVSSAVVSLGQIVTECVPDLEGYEPLIWLAFYVTALFFHIRGFRPFWVLNFLLGMVSLLIVLIFCFGSLSHINFNKYALKADIARSDKSGGVVGFMSVMPLAAWFFLGIETLNLASDQVERPTVVIPKAQICCVLTLFVTGAMVFFVAISLPPGISSYPQEFAALNRGFVLMFPLTKASATLLSLPATYATAFAFIWCYGKLISAMATSKLLPPVLAARSRYGTPYVAIVTGSVISYVASAVVFYTDHSNFAAITCITCAFLTYIAQCISYISLRLNLRNMETSTFRSPFGIAGAVFAIGVWVLALVGVAGFQENHYIVVSTLVIIIALLSVFYLVYARKRQTLSPQEKRVLLVARDLV